MTLLDRYLHSVRSWLPENLQSDLLLELEDDLRSEIEEKESSLGRPLLESELSALLKPRGHPLLAAMRMLPQQHLIGPAWYPIYRLTLRAVIFWILTPLFLLILAPLAAIASSHPLSAFLGVVFQLPFSALYAAGVITLIIAGIERLQLKVNPFQNWEPSSLPPAPPPASAKISRCESAFELAGGMLLLLWWTGIIQFPSPPEIGFQLAPVWATLYWPVLLVTLASLCLGTLKLLRPWWRPFYGVCSVILQLAAIAITAVLMNAPQIVIISGPPAFAAKIEKLASILDWSVQISFFVILVGCAYALFIELRRLLVKKKSFITPSLVASY